MRARVCVRVCVYFFVALLLVLTVQVDAPLPVAGGDRLARALSVNGTPLLVTLAVGALQSRDDRIGVRRMVKGWPE